MCDLEDSNPVSVIPSQIALSTNDTCRHRRDFLAHCFLGTRKERKVFEFRRKVALTVRLSAAAPNVAYVVVVLNEFAVFLPDKPRSATAVDAHTMGPSFISLADSFDALVPGEVGVVEVTSFSCHVGNSLMGGKMLMRGPSASGGSSPGARRYRHQIHR